ncbi:bromodomain adjacent to zinc finger domain protein 1A [Drosophila pseudoobscura]|uniref:Bromodomain adjacent to zinc finger domain protein 1A n=1 Tax=Drosophila pseudoobscura pseudoobscura TaxID=46245 RepID=A0A6I8UQ14_DROPS|nr:bromodomain adjacent to zinc finger domain protein 1A [Drosophila pseudoobscura]
MPICKREGFDLNQKEGKSDTFHDNDWVFCCYITNRIFRDYENYFRHVMAINSTVWQCEATGRESLTYEEAQKSERAARKKMEQFKQSLRAPVLLVVEHARQSAMKTLNLMVAKFLRKRYFINEEVSVVTKKNTVYVVVAITPGKSKPVPSTEIYEDTDALQYRLKAVKGDASTEITVPFDQIRRQRLEFNMENLGMFIKNNVTRVDGILRPKPEAYKQYVTDAGISFASIFIGKMPRYSPSKIKRPEAKETSSKKQSTLNKYIVSDVSEESAAKAKEKAKASAKLLAEEMERARLEKAAKLAVLEREKAEKKAQLMERVESECNSLLTKTDDLERCDQRVLPRYKPIVTLLPEKLLGDAFMMREFMHTYAGLLSGVEVFRQNLSFYEMTRALSAREVAGPLSDIILVLLGTVFDLQKEEEDECAVSYMLGRYTAPSEPYISMSQATRSHYYSKRHFSFKINELPLDALTLSEVLRLHLLSSGAIVNEKAEKWRIMYRNGYASREDPGLELRLQHPHILRSLKNSPVYQLSFSDIMRVIRCLMSQILTYSGTINLIEERMEQTYKAKVELRTLIQVENRRLAALEMSKRKLTHEHHLACSAEELKNDPAKKQSLLEKLNKGIAELHAKSDTQHRKHEAQVLALHSQLFNFLVFLGMDRCYRKYYVLESMPGIFVEHSPDNLDTCLEQPPLNKPQSEVSNQAQLPKNRRELRIYLLKLYGEEKSRKRAKQSLENKENQEHRINGDAEPMEVAEAEPLEDPTQHELMMCSGDRRNCIVHDHEQRQRWSYIYKAEDIDELLKSLNPLGHRESGLLEEINGLRTLIEQHVSTCPADMLTLESDQQRKKFLSAMHSETRKYCEANFGLPEDTNLNEVMQLHLVDRILQFERDIYTGDLGRLKVKDMEKWRNDLLEGNYDPQIKLQWGPGGKLEDLAAAGSDHESHEDYEDEEKSAVPVGKYATQPYRDPGQYLGPASNADELVESADEERLEPQSEAEMESLQAKVRNMAGALLQVEQAIGRRFLKPPYGMKKWDPKQDALKQECEARLHQWEVSLMESTSYAQLFLHFNMLHDCIQWIRSTNKSLCKVCRRGSDPDKMLLCDECNGGTHMFCMKPKMRSVPKGHWYCNECVKNLGLKNANDEKEKKTAAQRKRKFIVEEEDEDDTEEEDGEDTEEQEEEDEEEEDGTDGKSETSTHSSTNKLNGRPSRRPRGRPSKKKRLTSKEIEVAIVDDDDDGDEATEESEPLGSEVGDEGSVETTAGEDEDVEENENEEGEESDDDKVCQVCFYDGSEIRCVRCSLYYHLDCAQLKRQPRADFVCKKCKTSETQRPRRRNSHVNGHDDDDDDRDEPPTKRSRSSRNSLRISLDKSARHSGSNNNNNNSSTNNNNNHRRSGRRMNDNLPLNSAALYDLLEQIMKHKASWPFLRPVLTSEVPDYHQIIKTPMDLAKVKSKLNMGAYQLNEEVLNDIQLVFRNCDLYNVEGNEIYDAGCQLEKFVIERCRDMQLPFRPSDMNDEGVAIC